MSFPRITIKPPWHAPRTQREAGYSTVMIDLQAHGESSGQHITVGHFEKHDVRAAVEFARRQNPAGPIGVIGVSLGGASALLASPLEIDALVLESVYPNINDAIYNRVTAKLGPFAAIPSKLLLLQLKPRLGVSPSELRPIDHISDVACPVLVVSGKADQHTTASETRQMFAHAQEPRCALFADYADADRDIWLHAFIGYATVVHVVPPLIPHCAFPIPHSLF